MRKPSRNSAIQERAFTSRRQASLVLMNRFTRSNRPQASAKATR